MSSIQKYKTKRGETRYRVLYTKSDGERTTIATPHARGSEGVAAPDGGQQAPGDVCARQRGSNPVPAAARPPPRTDSGSQREHALSAEVRGEEVASPEVGNVAGRGHHSQPR